MSTEISADQTQSAQSSPATADRLAESFETGRVAINRFPPDDALKGEKPISDLVQKIIEFGDLRTPVEYVLDPALKGVPFEELLFDDPNSLTAGNRRIRASREALRIIAEKIESLHRAIDESTSEALTESLNQALADYQTRYTNISQVRTTIMWGESSVRPLAIISDHSTRRENDARTLAAVEDLLKREWDVPTIARHTGLKTGQVKRILRLTRLIPALRYLFDKGLITNHVAHRSARLSAAQQEGLWALYQENERLTTDDVRNARNVSRTAAASALTAEDFGPDSVDLPSDFNGETHPEESASIHLGLMAEIASLRAALKERDEMIATLRAQLEQGTA